MNKIVHKLIEGWRLMPGMYTASIINILLVVTWLIVIRNYAYNLATVLIATLLLPTLLTVALNLGWLYDENR